MHTMHWRAKRANTYAWIREIKILSGQASQKGAIVLTHNQITIQAVSGNSWCQWGGSNTGIGNCKNISTIAKCIASISCRRIATPWGTSTSGWQTSTPWPGQCSHPMFFICVERLYIWAMYKPKLTCLYIEKKILFAHAHRCHPFAKPPLGSASHIAGTECHFWPAIRSASGTAAAIRPAPGQGCFRTLVLCWFWGPTINSHVRNLNWYLPYFHI